MRQVYLPSLAPFDSASRPLLCFALVGGPRLDKPLLKMFSFNFTLFTLQLKSRQLKSSYCAKTASATFWNVRVRIHYAIKSPNPILCIYLFRVCASSKSPPYNTRDICIDIEHSLSLSLSLSLSNSMQCRISIRLLAKLNAMWDLLSLWR